VQAGGSAWADHRPTERHPRATPPAISPWPRRRRWPRARRDCASRARSSTCGGGHRTGSPEPRRVARSDVPCPPPLVAKARGRVCERRWTLFRRGTSFPACAERQRIAQRIIAIDQTGELQIPDRGAGGAWSSRLGRAKSDPSTTSKPFGQCLRNGRSRTRSLVESDCGATGSESTQMHEHGPFGNAVNGLAGRIDLTPWGHTVLTHTPWEPCS